MPPPPPPLLLLLLLLLPLPLRGAAGASPGTRLHDAAAPQALPGTAAVPPAGLPSLSAWRIPRHNYSQPWPPLDVREPRTIAATIVGAIGAALACAGGVGGGGLFVPLFNLLLQFDAKTSAALSKSMIFGGAVTSFLYNGRLQHPSQQRPLIDYDTVLLLEPCLLLGISAGVLCNIVFPSWLIIVLLTAILSYVTARSFSSARALWDREDAACLANGKQDGSLTDADGCGIESFVSSPRTRGFTAAVPWLTSVHSAENVWASEKLRLAQSGQHYPSQDPSALANLPEPLLPQVRREPLFPALKMLMLGLIWLSFLLIQILKGAHGPLHAQVCGPAYWILTTSQIPLALGLTAWIVSLLSGEHRQRLAQGIEYGEGDVEFDRKQLLLLPLSALCAGCMGGLLGIGGGMVISPLLVELGMLPQVVAATGGFMVLFSSAMSVSEFYLLGRIPVDYAIYFAIICMLSSLGGLIALQRTIVKYGRESLIIFAVAGVIAMSVLLMALFGTLDEYQRYVKGEAMGFHRLCISD